MIKFTIFPKPHRYTQKFDLLNDATYQEQRVNTYQYKRKSLTGKIGFILFGIAGYSLIFFRHNDLLGFITVGEMILAVVGSLFARCPHCNSLQPGRVYGLSFSGSSLFVSYAKGVWPFANCSYYLSLRKLEKDKLFQQLRKSGKLVSTSTEQSEVRDKQNPKD